MPHGNPLARAPDAARLASPIAIVSITQLAVRTGATVRALRHYEERGLIRSIRARSGARNYSPQEAKRAETIVMLRAVDISIEDIKATLLPSAEAGKQLGRLLRDRARTLERQLMLVEAALENIRKP